MSTPTTPFDCPEISRLVDNSAAAEALKRAALRWLEKREAVKLSVAAAEAAFLGGFSDEAAKTLARESDNLRDVQAAVHTLEKNGGPDGVQFRALHTAPNFATLSLAFARRAEAINAALPVLRKALSDKLAELALKGEVNAIVERHPEAVPLWERVQAAERALQAATETRNFTAQKPPVFTRTFTSLLAEVRAPLPF